MRLEIENGRITIFMGEKENMGFKNEKEICIPEIMLSNWFDEFFEDCLKEEKDYMQKSGILYSTYRDYAKRKGETAKSTTDFYKEIERRGFERKRNAKGRYVIGLKVMVEIC